jgi:hypothetical protein
MYISGSSKIQIALLEMAKQLDTLLAGRTFRRRMLLLEGQCSYFTGRIMNGRLSSLLHCWLLFENIGIILFDDLRLMPSWWDYCLLFAILLFNIVGIMISYAAVLYRRASTQALVPTLVVGYQPKIGSLPV